MKRSHKVVLFALLVLIVAATGCALIGCNDYDTLEVGGETRGYLVHVPQGLDTSRPAPLLLALHQFTDTAAGMRRLTGFDKIADDEGFIVAYPQGRRRAWRVGQGEDVAFLAALVEKLAAEHSIDRGRVYACGMSAGGMMAQYLACTTDLLAGVASVAGNPEVEALANCTGSRLIPVLLIHGTHDPIVPYAGGETYAGPGRRQNFYSAEAAAKSWAERNGCAPEPMVETLAVDDPADTTRVTRLAWPCVAGASVTLYRIEGGGHTWPGGNNWYPRWIVGRGSRQMQASEVIWRFFGD